MTNSNKETPSLAAGQAWTPKTGTPYRKRDADGVCEVEPYADSAANARKASR